MAFATMDDKDCLVRKTLSQFKWTDVESVSNGQTVQNKPLVLQLVTAANQSQPELQKPYVKVGLVKKHLVLRIKHSKGHFIAAPIKDDIILVKNYQRPQGADDAPKDKKGQATPLLAKSKSKNMLSEAWVKETFGAMPVASGINTALKNYQEAMRVMVGVPGLKAFAAAEQAIDALDTAAKPALRAVGHKDDQAIVQRFIHEVSQAGDKVAQTRKDYEKKLDGWNKSMLSQAEANTTKTMEDAMEKLRGALKKKDVFLSQTYFQNLGSNLRRPLGTAKNVNKFVNDFMADQKALADRSDLDIKGVQAIFKEAVAKYPGYVKEMDKAAVTIEVMMIEQGTLEAEPTPKNPDYDKKLKQTMNGYNDMVTKVDTCLRGAQAQLANVPKLAAQKDVDTMVSWILGGVDRICDDLEKLRSASFKQTQRARNSGSELSKLAETNKITSEDKQKFLTPRMNQAFNKGNQLSMTINKAMAAMEALLLHILKRMPNDQPVKDALKKVRESYET